MEIFKASQAYGFDFSHCLSYQSKFQLLLKSGFYGTPLKWKHLHL